MFGQIRALLCLELKNLYGLNVFRHTRDRKVKNRMKLLMVAWVIMVVMAIVYTGGLSYGLIFLGAEAAVPAYLVFLASLLILVVDLFKAGNVMYRKNGYDSLSSLPLSQTAVVISRFIRMYVENLAVSFCVMVPGMVVYSLLVGGGHLFWVSGLLTILTLPLIPMAVTVLFGALITGVSSRMKHKSLVEAGLSVLLVVGVMLASSGLVAIEGEITPEMLRELAATVLELLKKIYPPAVWLGESLVEGRLIGVIGAAGGSLIVVALMTVIVSVSYHEVCRRLHSTTAKHDYRMKRLSRRSVLGALYRREMKRYFASGIYVTNTIIGPMIGTLLAGTLLVVGPEQLTQILPVEVEMTGLVPFLIAGIFCMMPTTATSVSMEGKHWWIAKSLPLETKTILDAKLLMNLGLIFPFYLSTEVLLILALKPGFLDLVWLILIPALLILFACVFGITANLLLPVMDWESEVAVVKQSASSLVGEMGGFLLAVVFMVAAMVLPGEFTDLYKAVLCVLLAVVTACLYRKNNRTNLKEI